jgi:DNA modification methylase
MVVSNTFLQGDALAMLKSLPDECVQMVCTSPPYYGLRAYLPDGHPDKALEVGLEETPAAYVAKLVEVFREVKRVLRSDGVAWVNLGDSYAGSMKGMGSDGKAYGGPKQQTNKGSINIGCPDWSACGLRPKSLLGIPWRVAFALQEDGWILRADCIWHKTNAMPESVKDRPTKAHEYVFLLSKNERYFYDSDAIKESVAMADRRGNVRIAYDGKGNPDSRAFSGNATWLGQDESGRNKRSVWSLPTVPFPGSHFAVMAPKLAETCILAGTSPQACEHCGAPWQRVTEVERILPAAPSGNAEIKRWNTETRQEHLGDRTITHQKGWQPICTCTQEGTGRCIVLDPFSGAGTTSYVAMQHGRKYIGIELNPEYILMAEKRLDSIRGLWETIA